MSEDQKTERLYGISTGNGNDGISHMFADYYVKTNEPWRLARLALVSIFNDEYQAQALEECVIDGEAEYTIQACLFEPLDHDHNEEEDGSWCDANGAYLLVDVFPEDEPREGRPTYDGIGACFDEALLERIKE